MSIQLYDRSRPKSAKEIREELYGSLDEAQAILDKAADEKRELNAAEQEQVDKVLAVAGTPSRNGKPATGMYLKLEQQERAECPPVQSATTGLNAPTAFRDSRTGQPHYILGKEHSVQSTCRPLEDCGPRDPRPSLGAMIRGAITGRWNGAEREFRLLSEGSNAGGGFLVPDPMSAYIIDKARAASVCIQAGVQTIPMESETLRLARVDSDPAMELKAENAAFSGSDVTFGSVLLTSRLIGCMVTASRELAEDAVNFGQMIEAILAKALAAELDRQMICGTGSGEMLGLTEASGTGETTSVGAIAWQDVGAAVGTLWGLNWKPNSYIVSADVASDLVLLSGDNTGSYWISGPDSVKNLQQLVSSNCPVANLIVGQFDQAALGIRKEARVELTTQGGDSFAKHQVLIKITWRGDFALLSPTAFHCLRGITS